MVASNSNDEIVGIARLSKSRTRNIGRFFITVRDSWQAKGIGKYLLLNLIEVAKSEKLNQIKAKFLDENMRMRKICESLSFEINKEEDSLIRASLILNLS